MPAPPAWLQTFADCAAKTAWMGTRLPRLGCHFARVGTVWEVTLFPCGSTVSKLSAAQAAVDLLSLQKLFTRIERMWWQREPLGFDDELREHLSIEGRVGTRTVWLRLLKAVPARLARKARPNSSSPLGEEW